jgi:hypothetical protein
MEYELAELRRFAADTERKQAAEPEQPLWALYAEPPAVPAPSVPPPEPIFRPELPVTAPLKAPLPASRRELDLSALLGARALAWTGGAVMLLGIVFFFVLAVERGWIGPLARVSLGAAASVICLAAGTWLQRRFGGTYAAVSAAGVGVAGLYATLLAATALYDLVPRPAALALAGGIAALGAGLAILWNTQTLAALGLVGAALVPIPIALQDGHLSPVGTAFAVLILAATGAVAVPRDWTRLYAVTSAIVTLESFALVFTHEPRATAVAIAAWLVSGSAAVWLMVRERLTSTATSLALQSAVFAGWSAAVLYHGGARGYALLVVAGAYGVVSVLLWRRDRNAAAVLWAIALTLAAIAAALLVSGVSLTIVWAAEAAVLSRLARRVIEPKFQLAALVWLTLAYVHGVAADAPLTKLFVENTDTWIATVSAASLAVATAIVGLSTFDWDSRGESLLGRMIEDLRRSQPLLRTGALVLAAVAALYSASLAVVTLPGSWDWGHVAVAGLWSVAAVGLVAARLSRGALALTGAATVLALGYDVEQIGDPQRWWSLVAVSVAAVVVAVVTQLRSETDALDLPAFASLTVSVGLAGGGLWGLLNGPALGTGLLALAVGYGVLAELLSGKHRDFATAVGVAALGVAVPASVLLLDGTWLVLAWTMAAALLAVFAASEERLQVGSLVYLGLAFVHTLVFEAQPSDVFVAHRHPGAGAPAGVLLVVSCAVLAVTMPRLRQPLAWLGGSLALYAATLTILELFEDTGGGIDTAFQRGHTAVSAVWGIAGLMLLVAGLKQAGRRFQIAGFALFGLSLAKLFIYDLAFLSSVARAGSFLAVGAVLLIGGFFYQRLAGTRPTIDSPV